VAEGQEYRAPGDVAATTIGKLANPDAEAALLGALMFNNRRIDWAADRLTAEDFSSTLYGRVFTLLVREASLGRAANPVTLPPFLAGEEAFGAAGGARWLSEITDGAAARVDPEPYIEQIRMMSTRRQLVDALAAAIVNAGDLDVSTETILETADAALLEITDRGSGVHEPSGGECIGEVIASVDKPQEGVRSGLVPDIDRLAGPFQPKQLIIIAGRPGMAKTATAISLALGASTLGHGTVYFSLEMSSTELGARLATDYSYSVGKRLPYDAVVSRRLSRQQLEYLLDAEEAVGKLPLHIVDVGSLTMGRLDMMVRRYKRRLEAAGHKLQLVIVDYLQLLSPDERMKSNYEAVSEVSKRLKQIAKTHGVVVIALAQLSRQVEQRDNKRPVLSDLRDSGQIEQDADAVVFLYREEYYLRKSEPPEHDPKRVEWQHKLDDVLCHIEFICAKRRDGPEGHATGRFYGAFQAVRGHDFGGGGAL
jgi:replicative DNA helicase